MLGSILSWLWGAFVTIASALAFYKTHLEPEIKMLKDIRLAAISPPLQGRRPQLSRYVKVNLEVTVKEQGSYKFVLWADGEELPAQAECDDLGKTYTVNLDLPMCGERLPDFIKIDIKRWWGCYFLTSKRVPLPTSLQPITGSTT